MLIRNAKNRNLERVKAAYAFIHLIFSMPDVKSKMKNYSSERNALTSAEHFLGFLSEWYCILFSDQKVVHIALVSSFLRLHIYLCLIIT